MKNGLLGCIIAKTGRILRYVDPIEDYPQSFGDKSCERFEGTKKNKK